MELTINETQIKKLADLYNDTQESYDRFMEESIKEKNPVKRERIAKARYGRFCQISMLEKVCSALGLEVDYNADSGKFTINEKGDATNENRN